MWFLDGHADLPHGSCIRRAAHAEQEQHGGAHGDGGGEIEQESAQGGAHAAGEAQAQIRLEKAIHTARPVV